MKDLNWDTKYFIWHYARNLPTNFVRRLTLHINSYKSGDIEELRVYIFKTYFSEYVMCVCDLHKRIPVFWYVTLSGCLFSRPFEGTFRLHLQGIKVHEGLRKVKVRRSLSYLAMQRHFSECRNSRLHQR